MITITIDDGDCVSDFDRAEMITNATKSIEFQMAVADDPHAFDLAFMQPVVGEKGPDHRLLVCGRVEITEEESFVECDSCGALLPKSMLTKAHGGDTWHCEECTTPRTS